MKKLAWEMARSKSWKVREAVAKVIGEFKIYELKYLLVVLVLDGEGTVRISAQEAMKNLGYEDVEELYERLSEEEKENLYTCLEKASKSREWEVRWAVARTIGKFRIEELGHLLVVLVFDANKNVRVVAREAMENVGHTNVREFYESLSEKEKEKVLSKLTQLESIDPKRMARILDCEFEGLSEEIIEAIVS